VDHVDALFDRLVHGKPTDDLAAPEVAQKLRSFIRTLRLKQNYLIVGEFLDASVSHEGTRTLLCLWVDSYPGRFDFTLKSRHGGFYVTHVIMRRGESCSH
jgi:hypothetical protein